METHLASAFDHNLDGLQGGLAEAGFLFDSAWIPWTRHEPRDHFDDDEKEKAAAKSEDANPGILLFRNNREGTDPYRDGLIVLLISEKPTQGLSLAQVSNGWDILARNRVSLGSEIKIIGPTYSGSFASLTSMVRLLSLKDPLANFVIRSGGVTVGSAASDAALRMSTFLGSRHVDFGGALHDYKVWVEATKSELCAIGIAWRQVAILSEGESLYGSVQLNSSQADGVEEEGPSGFGCTPSNQLKVEPWALEFPRDISSLRAGYESQGVFHAPSPAEPWKRVLNLTTGDGGEGDTIRSFGGTSTLAIQEGILLGISGFVRTHSIRAVVVSATNPEDSYFLAQFLHAHNSNVRVVILGTSRIFLRESTAQFRGDMIVDDFPMLPRLGDWTGARPGTDAVRTFGDDVAEGVFFAAVDLFGLKNQLPKWLPEYSGPVWGKSSRHHYPSMFVSAVGSNSTWPLTESPEPQFKPSNSDSWQVTMPFELAGTADVQTSHFLFSIGGLWKWTFAALVFLTACYCACFWIADPITRIHCASFQPTQSWRFWVFRLIIPAWITVYAFQVLAWSIEVPAGVAKPVAFAWICAEICAIIAPLSIAVSAVSKAVLVVQPKPILWMAASFIPFLAGVVTAIAKGLLWSGRFSDRDFSSVVNAYREMRFESGLSLVPTLMFFLLAYFIWACQASSGAALLDVAPPLPRIAGCARISRTRGDRIVRLGKPCPSFRDGSGIWIPWIILMSIALFLHFSRALKSITSLEPYGTTQLVRWVAFAVVGLILMDLAHFLQLWNELRGLLRALGREAFKRSFVPIDDFTWTNIWSFNGTAFRDRRAIDTAMSRCALDLAYKHAIPDMRSIAEDLDLILTRYNRVLLEKVDPSQFKDDRFDFFLHISRAASVAAALLEQQRYAASPQTVSSDAAALQRAISSIEKSKDAFRDEREEAKLLPEWQQTAERLICLMYVGFIQAMIARLHTLLVSIASMFSLLVLGFAIYPFVPFLPLLLAGTLLLVMIGWAFYKVIGELDTDPILSRIVNGDDRRLQSNFYVKLAEAMALPLLALASTILPGGAGRILELAQALVNHGQ